MVSSKVGRWDRQREQMIGRTFGRLTVTGFYGTNGKKASFYCVCQCGKQVIRAGTNLKRKMKGEQSCGCALKKHHAHGTRVHGIWRGMRLRCEDPSYTQYEDYGGRGIQVCERWRLFANFYEDMGEPGEGMSLDRIDVNGDYRPENCRWADRVTQQNNMRSNRHVEYKGETKTIAEWSRHTGLPYHVIRKRLNKSWPVEKALTTPLMQRYSHARNA